MLSKIKTFGVEITLWVGFLAWFSFVLSIGATVYSLAFILNLVEKTRNTIVNKL